MLNRTAPFRGFVQERALRKAAGEPMGETLLFFGCDDPDVDLLYRDELAEWEAEVERNGRYVSDVFG